MVTIILVGLVTQNSLVKIKFPSITNIPIIPAIRVRPIYRLADISADIFGRYRYIGIGKLDIGIGHIGIGIGIG